MLTIVPERLHTAGAGRVNFVQNNLSANCESKLD